MPSPPDSPSTFPRLVGRAVERVEDAALLTGRGRFADDVGERPGTAHAAVLRSPHAHAEIVSLDAAAALSMPEVVTVLTGEEVAAWSRPFIAGVKQPMRHGDDGYDVAVVSNFQGAPFTLHPVMARALGVPGAAQCCTPIGCAALRRLSIPGPFTAASASSRPSSRPFPYVVAMCLASRKARCPVKWVEDRLEHLLAATSATNRVTTLEAAVTGDGTITALRWDQLDDCGAYLRAPEPASLYRTHGHMSGPYRIAHLEIHNRVVLTNKTPTGLNRGFGGPQVYFALERLVHRIAKTLGLDPLDVIRRNLVPGTVFRVFQQCQSISAVNAGLTMPTRWSDTSASTRRPASCVSASPTTTPRRRWTRR